MCKFLSALVTRHLEIFWDRFTDSHEDLIEIFNMRDNGMDNFVRIEFSPCDTKDLDKIEKYDLVVDQTECPTWFDDDAKEIIKQKLSNIVAKFIVKRKMAILTGGPWIISKAEVKKIQNARVIAMLGSSNVGEMLGSSKVGVMLGSSKVGVMRESSNVGVMWESSNVGEMRESSNVGVMWESSNVGVMWESSKIVNDNRKNRQ